MTSRGAGRDEVADHRGDTNRRAWSAEHSANFAEPDFGQRALGIEPALAAGAVVLCDRFIDSSIAYQGYGRGLSVDFITAANAFATKGRMPDCTVLMDVPVEVGKARREGGGDVNRLDMEASSFHAKVRDGYLAAAAANPERIKLIDAECDVDTLEVRVWDAIAWLFASGS